MAYQQQRPGYPHEQNYGGPAGVSALASKASEVGRKMGGVTQEIWDDILSQMQHLVEDNEKLRETLKANNNEIASLVQSKEEEVKHLHKLYWDARVSVLGFKAQIVKLNGEKDHDKQKQSDMSRLEEEKDLLQRKAITTSDLARNLQDEVNVLKYNLSNVEQRERKLTQDFQALQEENAYLKQSQSHHPPAADPGQINALERELSQLKLDLTKERRTISELRSRDDTEVSILKGKISELEEELREQRSMNDSLSAEVGQLRRTAGPAAQQERELQRQLQQKDSDFRAMRDELGYEISQLKIDLTTKDRKLQDKERELQAKEQELESEISELKRNLTTKDRKLAERERDLRAKDQELQAKVHELDDYKSRPDNFDGGEISKAGPVTGNIKRRLNDEIGKNKRLTKELDLLKEKLDSAASNEELATLEREKTTLEREKAKAIRDQERIMQEKERVIEDMERLLREKEKEKNSVIERLSREKNEIQQDLDESRNTEQESVDELSKTKDDFTHLESEKRNLVTELENEKERVYELNIQLSKAQSDLDQTKKQLQQAKAEAEGESTDLDKMMEEMSNEMTGLTEEINNKKEEIRRQKAHILQLSKERDDAVSQAAAYAKERDTAAAEYQKKENQSKAERQKKIEEYLSEAEQWKIQFEVAREDFNSERAAREKEAKAVDALRNNRESLQKQVDDLKDKVTVQQRTIANLEDRLSKHEPVDRTPLVPMDHGPPMDRSPGPIDRGARPMDRGPGPINRGPGPMDRGPRPMDRGPMDRGSGPMDHGPGPNRPSAGGPRVGGGGESPRNYRPDDRERMGTGGKAFSSVQPSTCRRGGDYGGGGRGDYGGGGGYQRHQHEPQRIPEYERRAQDEHQSRIDDYQPRPTGATDFGYYEGGGRGRMDDPRGRQFNAGGERRDFLPPQQPQPYVDFTPLPKPPPPKEGGAGGGRRGSDWNDLNQPRGQSGGGELFMGGSGRGGGGGGYDPRRQFPPDGGDGGNFPLPGERVDSSKPTGVCPICGVGNFATQTDLELHAAKCDKFD